MESTTQSGATGFGIGNREAAMAAFAKKSRKRGTLAIAGSPRSSLWQHQFDAADPKETFLWAFRATRINAQMMACR